jgi:hypothetical protein
MVKNKRKKNSDKVEKQTNIRGGVFKQVTVVENSKVGKISLNYDVEILKIEKSK